MPTRISAGVGDHLVSLLFIMIPIACKITNFSLYLFVYFFENIIITEDLFVKRVPRISICESHNALISVMSNSFHNIIAVHEKYL